MGQGSIIPPKTDEKPLHVTLQRKRIDAAGVLIEDITSFPTYNEPIVSPDYIICINHEGSADVEYDTETHGFHPHDVTVIYPNHPLMAIRSSDDYKATIVILSQAMFSSMRHHYVHEVRFRFDQTPKTTLSEEEYNDLNHLIESMRIVSRSGSPARIEMLVAMLDIVIETIRCVRASLSDGQFPQQRQLLSQKFYDAIIEHCSWHRNVDFYAQLFFLSKKHFSEKIKKETGRSASYWIKKYMVTNAKSLLRNHAEESMQSVSDRLGFPDQAAFSRFFKREVGLSPSAWRDRLRHPENN